MHERYTKLDIAAIWDDLNKLNLWQDIELAVIKANEQLGIVPSGVHDQISTILLSNPIDLDWWKARDNKIHHDCQAFVDERRRFLPVELELYFHGAAMTSFDTEEVPFATMIKKSVEIVLCKAALLEETCKQLALRYRYTIMMGHTHGQGGEIQTFGKEALTWLAHLRVAVKQLKHVADNLRFSKLSGAIGNYGATNPEVERVALAMMGFEPFYGATQIMPRILYAPISNALANLVIQLHKTALDIRLGARTVQPIYREPFSKTQKGSSAMPHKKNPVRNEQMQGLARMAESYDKAIQDNIATWEERSIEQSCVERVAWPDLFHVTVHALEVMTGVLSKLQVYPDNMLREIISLRGCHGTARAKDVLKRFGAPLGLAADDAYDILQLASFLVFEPSAEDAQLRAESPKDLAEAKASYDTYLAIAAKTEKPDNVRDLVLEARLKPLPAELEHGGETIDKWNNLLRQIFQNPEARAEWDEAFNPSKILVNEAVLFQNILGV